MGSWPQWPHGAPWRELWAKQHVLSLRAVLFMELNTCFRLSIGFRRPRQQLFKGRRYLALPIEPMGS